MSYPFPMIKAFFVFAVCFSISVFGSTKGIQIVAEDGRQAVAYDNSYALVIGVSDYTNGWPDLNAVPSELDEVQNLLERKGFKVTKAMNPDSQALRSALQSFVNEHGYDPNNRLLFYFSGHGYTRDNGAKGYLVPTNAPDPRRDERGFLRTAYSMTNLLALARNIEASHALFLFDSCFSGTIFKTKALPDQPPLITALTSKPVRQFITAGDAGETVPAKSVFTPAFIEALEYGTGDLNNDGYVTGSELGMHLQSTVGSLSSQTPQYGKINDFELSRGDYVFLASVMTPSSIEKTGKITAPNASNFSLDDIINQANEQKSARQSWDNNLQNMRNAYEQVNRIDQDSGVDASLKIIAWQRFQQEFIQMNPYSSADDEMQATSKQRVIELKEELAVADELLKWKRLREAGAISVNEFNAKQASLGVKTEESGFDVSSYTPIVKIEPVYPRSALSNGLEGWAIVEFTVTETGSVVDPVIVKNCAQPLSRAVCAGKPNSVFDSASQKAALKFKYKPRVVNGIAVATRGVQSQFEYELGE